MTPNPLRVVRGLCGLLLGGAAVLAAAIAFDSPGQPFTVPGGGAVPGMATWNSAEIPPLQHVTARDGAPLAYRAYRGRPDRTALLVHGSAGTGLDLHKLALALQAAGATAYSLSLRGHGGSGRTPGDVSYVGQLDDDLADLVKALGIDKPGQKRTLIGYSAGGGFALRTASGRMQGLFDNYIAVSPYIASYTALARRHMGPWANSATLRIAGLLTIEELGLDWFQDLIVVRYAVDPKPDERHTPAYTYRLLRSLHMGLDRHRELTRVESPVIVLTSDADDLSNADSLGSVGNVHIQFQQIKGLEHEDMVVAPAATAEIVVLWRKLNGDGG